MENNKLHYCKHLVSYAIVLIGAFVMFSANPTQASPNTTTMNNSTNEKLAVVNLNTDKIQGDFDAKANIHVFKGVPFAEAPINELRWRPPKALSLWEGIKYTGAFADRCLQLPLFDDMVFRASGNSEDCLYLNIWTQGLIHKENPENTNVESHEGLPVLLYFYGGGFHAGDASEPRYDGASFARNGVITVSANYRLGVFGLLAHPELSAESDYAGSGSYTFMDQAAALQWVVDNIAAFGGDPKRITIAGESAGAMSVSALMASPLSKNNIAGAIGQSGSILGPTLASQSLSVSEQVGLKLAQALGAVRTANKANNTPSLSIEEMRKMPAEALLNKAQQAGFTWFMPTVDGYFFPADPHHLYQTKAFAQVPLLAGNNSQEGSFGEIFQGAELTQSNYIEALKRLYPNHYKEVATLYKGETVEETA